MLEHVPDEAPLVLVTDERLDRGREIARRRKALGVSSVHAFARESGKSREAINAAEHGRASLKTYVYLEQWLAEREATRGPGPEPARAAPEHETEIVTFDITGPKTDWHVTISGPLDHADELRRQVSQLLRESGILDAEGPST